MPILDPGTDYNKLLEDRRAAFGPSADPLTSATDLNQHGGPYSFEAMWEQPTIQTPGYGKGAGGAVVKLGQGGIAGGPMVAPGGPSGMAGAYGGGDEGSFGGVSGGYELPGSAAASQAMRDVQMGAMGGLTGLMNRDTTAKRKAVQDALYAGQAEGINTAADRSRAAMLEGTFGRGVGSSSITTELYGRGEQEREDALSRALREAFTQAGSEDRADLASEQGLYNTSGALATAGLQGEANVALTNLARQQQESQFSRNLGFQGSENAANRSQQASQFGQNLGLQYSQLGQQASQFGQNLAFQGGENALNRGLTTSENALNRTQQSSEAELNRQLQQMLLESQQTFQGGQAGLNRDFTSSENAANRTFQGTESAATRALQEYLASTGQTWTAGQNQATRDQQMQMLLLQLANQQEIAGGNQLAGGLSAAGTGIGAVLGPFLAQLAKNAGG